MVTQYTWPKGEEKNNFKFATAVDLNKCPKQVKMPVLLCTCANLCLSYHHTNHWNN